MSRKSKNSRAKKQAAKNKAASEQADYDNPWKGMLDRFLPAFLVLFFPEIHQLIDWSRPYESLGTDLLKFTRDSDKRGRIADRAFKVRLKGNGPQVIIVIHIEIQAQVDPTFPERMFIYYYRLFDRYHFPILSMALLADINPQWKPTSFHNDIGPLHLRMDFPTTKLLDFHDRIDELEASDNPFAIVALAHLRHLRLRQAPFDLAAAKLDTTRLLLSKNFSSDLQDNVFIFLDWIMSLPDDLERQFVEDCTSLTDANNMPFLAPFEKLLIAKGIAKGEQLGIAKGEQLGIAKGIRDSLLRILESRNLGEPSEQLYRKIVDADVAQLDRWLCRASTANSIHEVFGECEIRMNDEG